jgi:hypothetical protein
MTTCTKKPYEAPQQAIRALILLQASKYPNLRGIHFCPLCRAWHTTSKKQCGRLALRYSLRAAAERLRAEEINKLRSVTMMPKTSPELGTPPL